MNKFLSVLGSALLASMMLSGCGDNSADEPDTPIVIPDAGPADTDSGPQDTDSGIPTDADAGDAGDIEPEDGGIAPTPDAGICTPKTADELKATLCSPGEEDDECGTKTADDGCGGTVEVNCGCEDGLSCAEGTGTCTPDCVPLNPVTGNAYYCHPNGWECGGKIERDDLCGGKVMVNCGGDTACKNNTVCITDPESDSYLHCVKEGCTPEPEPDSDFCERYHSECGTARGKNSCEEVKLVNCGSCTGTDICVGQLASGGYSQRTCEARPAATPIEACAETEGDTSAQEGTSHVMLIEENNDFLYSAPEVIYAFTATATGNVTVTAAPWNKSTFDLVLYAVANLADRTPIQLSNTSGEGGRESITFQATKNTTYYLVVDGADFSSQQYDRGPFHITVDDGTCSSGSDGVIISAIYTGGETGASNNLCNPDNQGPTTLIGTSTCQVWKQDYIELHNTSAADIDINGYSLMKTGADNTTGKNWQEITAISRSTVIPAGGYFLISATLPSASDRTSQDLPEADKTAGKNKFQLGGAHKIFLSKDGSVTSATMNSAGTPCPATDDKGFLFVFGQSGACGFDNEAVQANQLYYSPDGCSPMELTDFAVRADPVTDQYNNTTHPITSITPRPRTGSTEPHTCSGPIFN